MRTFVFKRKQSDGIVWHTERMYRMNIFILDNHYFVSYNGETRVFPTNVHVDHDYTEAAKMYLSRDITDEFLGFIH